jgi:RHH-type proline utilization regulon transcriptional repressor/proline dehydrogenase/delta 1-pyrroline-5-carboxylate dehydrogenase
MVGAVVGVQPFGGEGLSGTGPKAGGPLYLLRLLARHPGPVRAALESAMGPAIVQQQHTESLQALEQWAAQQPGLQTLHSLCQQLPTQSPAGLHYALPGPTGERNTYTLLPRNQVLCQVDAGPDSESALLHQLAAVLAVGGQVLWAARHAPLYGQLPETVQQAISLLADGGPTQTVPSHTPVDVALHCGSAASLQTLLQQLAARSGPLVACQHMDSAQASIPLERLLLERAVSINTAAAGGNASLMTMA